MTLYKCPGEFNKTCGAVVEGIPHISRAKGYEGIIKLENHPGCRRRYEELFRLEEVKNTWVDFEDGYT